MSMLSGGIKTCKYCKVDGHTAFNCPRKPRKQLSTKTRIKKIGKLGKAYIELRKEFFKLYPGDEHYCYYCLYLDIEVALSKRQTQVEHYYSKAHHPEMRFDMTNLVSACAYHNRLKGSLDGPEFLQMLDETKG